MDIPKAMWETLTTFSEESQKVVFNKCEEFGFDPNRGEIKLQEAFINLDQSRDILSDAIEKSKITQFPLSIQKTLLNDISSISSNISNLLSGKDEVVNLVNNIETFYADIWKFGFHNLSEEFLGHVTKMNQLKYQATKSKELQKELEKGLDLKIELEKILSDYKKTLEEIQNLQNAAQANSELIKQEVDKIAENTQKGSAHLATIEQNNTTTTQLVSTSKSSNAEIVALEGKIKEFFATIDTYKKEITNTSENAKKSIAKNDTDTRGLVKELKELEGQIKDQIEKATGHSLFHSFQTRQGKLVQSKTKWIVALVLTIAASIGLTYWIATSTNNFDIGFYLKLSMSIPLIFAITFCTVQYSKERKLEEEYAFKSNISISLIPYKELVEKFVDKTNQQEREKFTNFLIASIENVFTSPTGKVFDVEEKESADPEKALKKLGDSLTTILKPFESVFKLMKH